MKIINLLRDQTDNSNLYQEFSLAIKHGLSAAKKSIPSKYLYDDAGSQLFKKITQLDEYYLTNTEATIIDSIQGKLTNLIDTRALDIIELGVGDGSKSQRLIDFFVGASCDINYFPIDISEEAFELLKKNHNPCKPYSITAIVADYLKGLDAIQQISSQTKLVILLGSNIGNFTLAQAQQFVSAVSERMSPGDYFFIGFDLKKEVNLLQKAYSDSQGVTRAFNKNILTRINRELDGEFDLDSFTHHAIYNPKLNAMESYLLSLKAQKVPINALEMTASFDYLEPIHLEYSLKYNRVDIESLASKAGFKVVHNFEDNNHYFIDSLWQLQTCSS